MPTTEYKLGHVLDVLRSMEKESVEMCITSPPYYGARFYDIPDVIWDAAEFCEHEWAPASVPGTKNAAQGNTEITKNTRVADEGPAGGGRRCTKCPAWEGQLGLEPAPEDYIRHLCEIFDEVRRVLKPWGTLWVNLGDVYMDKNLSLIPSRFAIEMQERHLTLRNDVVWLKPNAMCSPIKDRFSNTFEHIFFFAKSRKYWFDLDSVRVPHETQIEILPSKGKQMPLMDFVPKDERDHKWVDDHRPEAKQGTRYGSDLSKAYAGGPPGNPLGKNPGDSMHVKQFDKRARHELGADSASQEERAEIYCPLGKNPGDVLEPARSSGELSKYDGGKRLGSAPLPPNPGQPHSFHPLGGNPGDIFEVPTHAYQDAHYATFPPDLIKTPILAACPEKTCPKCHAPWWRILSDTTVMGGLQPECSCEGNDGSRAGIVLDPFAGSGTTLEVARSLGRSAIGIDLGEDYRKLWKARTIGGTTELEVE